MILTKSKEANLSLTSGVTETGLFFNNNFSSGNYWVDWAESFVSFCEGQLGLEVQKGPGTSIGVITTNSSNTYNYVFDCDWTQPDGIIPEHEYYEKGKTLWEGVDLWDINNNADDDGTNDATTINLLPKGIDKQNKRFDFIVWFTTDEIGKERLGLRFRYPLTTQRCFGYPYYVSTVPACVPWKKENTVCNNSYRLKHWKENVGAYRRSVDSSTFNEEKVFLVMLGGQEPSKHTESFYQTTNYNWVHYKETSENEEELYDTLGGYGWETPGSYRNDMGSCAITLIISKNKRTIDLQVRGLNSQVLIDILYGDLIEQEVGNSSDIKSFVMVSSKNTTNYMANFILTNDDFCLNPLKQINRPTSADMILPTYCGISRVLLEKETLHCQELYQVFSFPVLMNDSHTIQQVFLDKNDDEHNFVLFNYGDASYSQSVAFAVPI